MWLYFALSSTFFWALVHTLDAYCVERVFDKAWMGVITSGLSSLIVILALPFAAPFVVWEMPGWRAVALAMLAGSLVQLSQALYFQALEYSEAGIVAAYWNMVPIILPVASYFLLGQSLNVAHYIGIAVLVIVSGAFCLLESQFNGRIRSFSLMIIACLLQTAFFLVNKALFDHCSFFIGFLLVTLGIIVSGSIPLLFSPIRKAFAGNMATLKPAIPMLVGIEVINLVAYFFSQRAISLGEPSLVEAECCFYQRLLFAAHKLNRRRRLRWCVSKRGSRILAVAPAATGERHDRNLLKRGCSKARISPCGIPFRQIKRHPPRISRAASRPLSSSSGISRLMYRSTKWRRRCGGT
ncbi:MAG: EamA family transporter [Blastocatellia bacterium]